MTWSSPCLILHQVFTRGLPLSYKLHPACSHRPSDPRSRGTAEAGQQPGPQSSFQQMWRGAPWGHKAAGQFLSYLSFPRTHNCGTQE